MVPVIEINGVSWTTGGKTILSGVDWRVKPGEHWAVLGLNGSGKTSLMRMINGYVHPSSGSLSVLGEEFGRYDWRVMRRRIGFVSTSLAENFHPAETAMDIALGGLYATLGLYDIPTEKDFERAASALDMLGAGELAPRPFTTLSQGERQKVLIARAMAGGPRILALDEPCEGLDIVSRESLLKSVGSVASGDGAPNVLYVTHRPEEVLPVFTHALLIRRGRVFYSGNKKDAFTDERLSEFLGIKVEVSWRNGRPSVTV